MCVRVCVSVSVRVRVKQGHISAHLNRSLCVRKSSWVKMIGTLKVKIEINVKDNNYRKTNVKV